MIHGFLLVFGVFWVGVGIVMCVMLVLVGRKARAAMLLVTIPAIVIVAILSVDFACRLLHLPRSVMPHQKQIISGINEALWLAAIPLSLVRLWEWWAKRRAGAAAQK